MKAVEVSAENLIVEVGNQQKIKPSTMSKDTEKAVVGLSGVGLGLDELVRHGARQVIQQAIEAELSELMERFANVKTLQGQRAVVRNGYLPEREVLTAAGPIAVKVPKVRDRSGSGVKFNSAIVPPYVRKSPRVSAALLWLYLKGISTGDMGEALSVLLGDDAKGLSANVVSRLKAQWADEHVAWSRRDMSESHYVYWWVDGIHTGLRSENSDGQCLLVIIGVKPDGSKERVAIGDGYRETKASWLELLLDLKKRGLKAGPRLAVGDGAMGFWAALEEVFPTTRGQRCWFHKMGKRHERAAQVATGTREGRHAIDLDGGDPRRRARGVRSFRVDLCGQISEGDRDVEEGPRELARVLRIPCRALAAFAHDQRD